MPQGDSQTGPVQNQKPLDAPATEGHAETLSLYDALEINAQARATDVAYRAKRKGLWISWTWAETLKEVQLIHALLAASGVAVGDTIALAGEASPRLLWYVLAAQRAGAVPLLLHPHITTQDLEEARDSTGFSILVVTNQHMVQIYLNTPGSSTTPGKVILLEENLPPEADYRGVVFEEKMLIPTSGDVPAAHTQNRTGAVLPRYGNGSTQQFVHYSNEMLRQEAAAFATASRIKPGEELLSFLPHAFIGDFMQFAASLIEGARLSSPESAATVFNDLPSLAPDILVAPAVFLRKLYHKTIADIHHSSTLARWAFKQTLALSGNGNRTVGIRLFRGILRAVFTGPLKQMTGLSHLRMVFCTGGVVPGQITDFFEMLNIPVKTISFQPGDPDQGGNSSSLGYPTVSLRKYAEMLEGCLLVKHAVFRPLDSESWAVLIDPDREYLRTICSDPGADYAEHVRQEPALEALEAAVLRCNDSLPDNPIGAFGFMPAPLRYGTGLTVFGELDRQALETILPDAFERGSHSETALRYVHERV
ncbi:MAG: AMP-binding protein [Rhizobiaceae bacterium]|nr:AMP-binding protein [Rhizobiaceae bacterium]